MRSYRSYRSYQSRDDRIRDLQRGRAAAERLATTPLFPASGAMWESIGAGHPDIPEASLTLLLSLVIDFWWHGEVSCINEDGPREQSVYVELGSKHRIECAAEMNRIHPAHYVVSVHGCDYLVIDKDLTDRGGRLFSEREFVEVGICPEARVREWYYDRDMRESTGYRSILHLPMNERVWRPPPRPNDLFEGPLVEGYERGDRAGYEAYEARIAEVERQEIETRIRLILGQAWKLQYLLRVWCGFNLDENLWRDTIDQILAIPTSKPGQTTPQTLSLVEAIKKFASGRTTASYDDPLFSKLQMVLMLQLADRQRRGESSPLVDPLNPKGQGFVAALNQYKELPGLRTSLHELRTLDKPSRHTPHHDPEWDY